jgi:hypothetical protein
MQSQSVDVWLCRVVSSKYMVIWFVYAVSLCFCVWCVCTCVRVSRVCVSYISVFWDIPKIDLYNYLRTLERTQKSCQLTRLQLVLRRILWVLKMLVKLFASSNNIFLFCTSCFNNMVAVQLTLSNFRNRRVKTLWKMYIDINKIKNLYGWTVHFEINWLFITNKCT